MMLDEFSSNHKLQINLNATHDDQTSQMNLSNPNHTDIETTAHQDISLINNPNVTTQSNNSTSSSSSSGEQKSDYIRQTNNNQQHIQHQQQQVLHRDSQPIHSHQQHSIQYFTTEPSSSYAFESSKIFEPSSSSSLAVSSPSITLHVKTESNQIHSLTGTMNVESTPLSSTMVPAAHCSDSHINYSFPMNKTITESSSTSMALNFSHDLLQQSSHHNQTVMHQHNDTAGNSKTAQLTNSIDLGSGALMQSAVGMNMWKSSMSLNHFKHPALGDHNFLPNSEMNSFPSWSHGNGIGTGHQSSSMTHHILEGQHLIGYPPHQRTLPLPNQDLMGTSMKSQMPSEQATFMLNSINQQASASQSSSSNHQSNSQPLDNLSLRSHHLNHNASYNLSMNDNQFYSNSRTENRSHPNAIKSSMLIADRSVHISLGEGNESQLTYQANDHPNLQPTTSHQVPGSSSEMASRNSGSFRCSTCNEIFTLKTAYQSHLKTHSNDKGGKAKFQCELCGHSFSQKTSLNRHMKSHTGERPFPCEICQKAFSEKERLKIHMRTHTGEKPFSCNICGKSFSQKSTVKRHQTVHTGEKKFRCDCGKGFANRGNLIAHIKTRGSNHFE